MRWTRQDGRCEMLATRDAGGWSRCDRQDARWKRADEMEAALDGNMGVKMETPRWKGCASPQFRLQLPAELRPERPRW